MAKYYSLKFKIMKIKEAILRQFKSLPVKSKTEKIYKPKKTIPFGFIVDFSIENEDLKLCKSIIGLTPERMNSSFHKSWGKIEDTPQEQLWFEQILHYFTTYGFKELGIYDESTVFIPHEKLKIPGIKKGMNFTLIRGITKGDLKIKVMEMLSIGIALKEETTKDYLTILKYTGFDEKDLGIIKNKEMAILLCDEFDIVPSNPTEILRYLVYSVTEKTLLIKDGFTIDSIKNNKSNTPYIIFKKADLQSLSTIFNRFKPIFLAFKSDGRLISYINKISKLSKKHHKPMPVDYLNTVTSLVAPDIETLNSELQKANIFRKIRLLYALNIRLQRPKSLLYKIRNGKSFIKPAEKKVKRKILKSMYNTVLDSIVKSMNVKNKKIHIPKTINYTLPATEKQFTGEYPAGTSIKIDKDMVIGVYWEDFEDSNVDLDLSTISMEGKIGWNSIHKNQDLSILFSGDMTDSTNGASELFYISKGISEPLLIVNNLYSGNIGASFKIFVAKEKVSDFQLNYVINPNNILLKTTSEMSSKEKILGIIIPTKDGGIKFVLSENSTNGHISSDNKITTMTREYLYDYYTSSISLKKILKKAGAKFVSKEQAEIDLSPEIVNKNDFIKLIN